MFNTTSPKVRKQIFGLLTNRWAISCLAVLLFQQILEASSTFWLVKLMERIISGENFYPFLILYLGAIVIPYIPWCIAFILKSTWKQEAERSFINTFVASNKNYLSEWGNKAIKEEKLSILTTEGPNALNALIDYVFDFSNYALTVILNILALSIVVEPLFAIAYGLSVSFVFMMMKMQKKKQRNLTQQALAARIGLCQSLLASWDNVLLGNEYNFKLWTDKTSQRLALCLQRTVELERFNQILAIITSLITSIPSLCVVGYFAFLHENDRTQLSSFVVTLPILFLILSYTYHTLSLAFKWTMHRSKLMAIYRAIQASREGEVPLQDKVQWSKLAMTQSSNGQKDGVCMAVPQVLRSHDDLLQHTARLGRFTIRGENGSGKSTALMLIKQALLEKSYFLPTHNQLSFTTDINGSSTGESLRHRLTEILQNVDADVLLLDEWDANLDKENRQRLSDLIDQLSERKCVIEVRHR